MAFLDFIKSGKEKKREKMMAERKAISVVEQQIENLEEKQKGYEKERDNVWNQARLKLQSGQKAEAARLLKTYKSQMVLINRTERQKQFAQHKLDQITSARDTAEMVKTLGDLARTSEVSPEDVQTYMTDLEITSKEIQETNNTMDRAISKEMDRLNREVENEMGMDMDDDLMQALEAEVEQELLAGGMNGNFDSELPRSSVKDQFNKY